MERGFFNRAPRYFISKEDCSNIYLVGVKGSREFKDASIVNISETGALCRIKNTESVEINETFLFEFKVPGLPESIVWKGRVARFQWTPEELLVGIHFQSMPDVFLTSLRRGLRVKLREAKVEEHLDQVMRYSKSKDFKEYVIIGSFILSVIGAITYLIMNPSSHQKNLSTQQFFERIMIERDIATQKEKSK